MEENFYEKIKDNLLNNEVYKKVKDYSKNKNDLDTYYKVGELLAKAGKHYGEGIIKEYSRRLINELGRKYSVRTLKYMRQFYNIRKGQPVAAELSWSHWIELMSIKDKSKLNYYIQRCKIENLSKRQLRELIKSKEYERLPEETKNKLSCSNESTIKDLVPNPILIKNGCDKEIVSEKALHQLIIENIESFMKQLGTGYAFIGSEYKIKIGNRYNYVDFLLFNYKFNCFIVVDLKVTELKKRTYWSNSSLYELY